MYRWHRSCWTSFSVAVVHLKVTVAASADQAVAATSTSITARARIMSPPRIVLDEAREQQRERRDVGDRDQRDRVDDDERDEPRYDLRRGNAEHGLGDEHVDGERRREHPHGEVRREDDPEVDEIDAGRLH